MDTLFPALFGCIFGMAMGLWLHRLSAYVLFTSFVYLLSPLSSPLLYLLERIGLPLISIKKLTAIFCPNTDIFSDPLYGLPVELQRWTLLLFWIGVFSLFLLVKIWFLHPKYKKIFFCILGLWVVGTGWYTLSGHGCLPHSSEPYIHYTFMDEGVPRDVIIYDRMQQREEIADFSVTDYWMDFQVTDSLSGHVVMQMDRKQPEYHFTFYYGYHIFALQDQNGNDLTYSHEGDYLTVYTDGSVDTISLTYNGWSGENYTNFQGVFLPGYFSYYPVPGFYKTSARSGTDQRIPVVDKTIKNFTVTCSASIPIYSNLSLIDGVYKGTTDAVTLMGGMMEKKSSKEATYLYLPVNTKEPIPISIDLLTSLEREKASILSISPPQPIDEKYLLICAPEVKFIQQPCIAFENHAISFGRFDPETTAYWRIDSAIPFTGEKKLLAQIYFRSKIDALYASLGESVLRNPASLLYCPKNMEDYYGRLYLAETTLGAEEVKELVIQYLNSDTVTETAFDFLDRISQYEAHYKENKPLSLPPQME